SARSISHEDSTSHQEENPGGAAVVGAGRRGRGRDRFRDQADGGAERLDLGPEAAVLGVERGAADDDGDVTRRAPIYQGVFRLLGPGWGRAARYDVSRQLLIRRVL